MGYQIRLESCVSPRTCLTFCTYGVLLRSLMGGDAILSSLTHVVVDEIHERDAMSDFLLTVLRDALARHRGLRLVLMSATVDTEQILAYFAGCVHLGVGGKMFPVQEWHLETVLEKTNYWSRDMRKNRCSARTRQSLENLTAQLALGPGGKLQGMEEEDVVIEEQEEEAVPADQMLDEVLGACFLSGGEEEFLRLQELLEEEETVAYRHSVTGVTALMVAASRGRAALVELGLQLGADPRVRAVNGWTALDFSRYIHGAGQAYEIVSFNS